jgi:hypothetical protein
MPAKSPSFKPAPVVVFLEPSPHLCAQCKTPLGKSSIPCKNEPKESR